MKPGEFLLGVAWREAKTKFSAAREPRVRYATAPSQIDLPSILPTRSPPFPSVLEPDPPSLFAKHVRLEAGVERDLGSRVVFRLRVHDENNTFGLHTDAYASPHHPLHSLVSLVPFPSR